MIYRSTHTPYTRFGVLVGRRLGNAVVRNRVKRRCRELIRRPDLQRGSYDVLILPRAASVPLCGAALRTRLIGLLGHLT